MSSNFDWHIGSEPEREVPSNNQEPPRPQRQPGWLWIVPLLIVAMLIPAYLVFHNYAARAETAARADILTAHAALWQAAQRHDAELFQSLRLSTPQQNWSWQMDTLFAQVNLFNRPQMELTLQPTPPEIITVTIAPTLDMAQLTVRQQYETAGGDSLTLQHHYAYQLQDEQWLLAPLDDTFWGDWQQAEDPWLTTVYLTRDAAISQRLAADLNSLINQLCQTPDLVCPSDLHLELSLRPEYNSLIPDEQYASATRLSLPTPSLLGLPNSESGYQTLYRYYGRYLAERLRIVLPPVGLLALFDNGRLAQAAWQRLLIQHDLITWPPPTPETSPAGWPEAALAALCLNEDNSGLDWWHYQPQTAEWHKILSRRHVLIGRPLAGAIFLIQEQHNRQTTWTLIWPDGVTQPLPGPTFAEPDIRLFANGQQLRLTSPQTADALLLDVAACYQSTCAWEASPETVAISPNGRQKIRQQGSGLVRSNLTDEDTAVIEIGYAPFWLQDQIYGYLRPMPGNPGEVEIVAAPINDDRPYLLLTTQDLRAHLPANTGPLTINSAALSPTDFARLIVQAYAPEQNRTFNFSLYRITGQITLLPMEEQITSRGSSPDGRWFLHFSDGLLHLNPSTLTSQVTLIPPTPACAYAAWVE